MHTQKNIKLRQRKEHRTQNRSSVKKPYRKSNRNIWRECPPRWLVYLALSRAVKRLVNRKLYSNSRVTIWLKTDRKTNQKPESLKLLQKNEIANKPIRKIVNFRKCRSTRRQRHAIKKREIDRTNNTQLKSMLVVSIVFMLENCFESIGTYAKRSKSKDSARNP